MIGCLSGQIISSAMKAEKCMKRTSTNRRQINMETHLCTANHVSFSGLMEGFFDLELAKDVFNRNNGKVYLNEFVNDDDSTMSCLLQHKVNADKFKLPDNISQLKFRADLSHRIKVMAKPFFNGKQYERSIEV